MDLSPLISIYPKIKNLWNFYLRIYEGKENEVLEKTLDQLSRKTNIDKPDLKSFLENSDRNSLTQEEREVVDNFSAILYKNIYEDPDIRGQLFGEKLRSFELKLEEINNNIKLLNSSKMEMANKIIDYDQCIKMLLADLTDSARSQIDFYIPISLKEKPLNFFKINNKNKKIETQHIPAKQILIDHDHVIILGDPGSGKSCLINKLAIDIIKELHLIPIVIEAKYWGFAFKTIQQAIKYVLKPYLINIEEDVIVDHLNKNKYVILIDGYDEISERSECFDSEIISLTRNINRIKVVLTSRKANYHDELTNLKAFEINELNDSQINEYAKNVISCEYFSSYLSQSNLLELARLPLYLYMLCSNLENNERLPKNKAMLYHEFIFDLLENRLYKRIKPKYTLQQKLQFLSRLAEKKTKDHLYNNFNDINNTGITDDATTFMKEILSSSILKGNCSSFDFIHPTFREYFYAQQITSYDSKEIIKFLEDHHEKDDFLEIILFLVGIPKDNSKQREILDFLETNNLKLYIRCLAVRHIILENTNNILDFEYNYLSQLQRSYNSLLENFFNHIKFSFYPFSAIPLSQVHLTKRLSVQVIGYIDVLNSTIAYGYKFAKSTDSSEPQIISKKSFVTKFDDGTPFRKFTRIQGLDLDSAREIAIEDIKKELKGIIVSRCLIHPLAIACEMIVAEIKNIASSAHMFVDKSLESLWKYEYGIYDAREYYGGFNDIKDHPYLSCGSAPKRHFDAECILNNLKFLIYKDISLKEKVLPAYFLDENSPCSGAEMEKRLVSRLNMMYSILPKIYLEVIKRNFPELQKYMRYANIYPFKCIVRYRYGIDFSKKGLVIDPLGEASVYFKPVANEEDLIANVEKGNPEICEEEQIKLSIDYKNNLKSLGRYSNKENFQIFTTFTSNIIDNLALTKAIYELLIEDLEWLLDDLRTDLMSKKIALEDK